MAAAATATVQERLANACGGAHTVWTRLGVLAVADSPESFVLAAIVAPVVMRRPGPQQVSLQLYGRADGRCSEEGV